MKKTLTILFITYISTLLSTSLILMTLEEVVEKSEIIVKGEIEFIKEYKDEKKLNDTLTTQEEFEYTYLKRDTAFIKIEKIYKMEDTLSYHVGDYIKISNPSGKKRFLGENEYYIGDNGIWLLTYYRGAFNAAHPKRFLKNEWRIESLIRIENNKVEIEKIKSDWLDLKYSSSLNPNDNLGFDFEISYPVNWYVKSVPIKSRVFQVENIEEKVVVAGGGPFTEHGSFLSIDVFPAKNSSTIEEHIRNSDLPERVKNKRLKQILTMKIGGIETIVWVGKGYADNGFNFICGGNYINIHCMSGSREQYEKDLRRFNKMVESFRILK